MRLSPCPSLEHLLTMNHEQIRARRLAKLGTSSTPKPDSEQASSTTESPNPVEASGSGTTTPKRDINITPASSKPAGSEANPFKQMNVPPNSKVADNATSKSTGSSSVVRRKRSASEIDDGRPATSHPPRNPASQASTETDEDYTHRMLTNIFKVTADPLVMSDPQGQRLVFLQNLNQELNDSGMPLKLCQKHLDQTIIEACNLWPVDKPIMNYLLPCWKRAVQAANKNKVTEGPRFFLHEEAKRLTMSNAMFSLSIPQLFK